MTRSNQFSTAIYQGSYEIRIYPNICELIDFTYLFMRVMGENSVIFMWILKRPISSSERITS
jgi:hypothetical protein